MMLVSAKPIAEVNAKAKLETTATHWSSYATGELSCNIAFNYIFDDDIQNDL